MPCGGIGPMDGSSGECTFVCKKPGAKHFCEEWDTYIHARCVPKFLQTPEGRIIMQHAHIVHLDFYYEKEG